MESAVQPLEELWQFWENKSSDFRLKLFDILGNTLIRFLVELHDKIETIVMSVQEI